MNNLNIDHCIRDVVWSLYRPLCARVCPGVNFGWSGWPVVNGRLNSGSTECNTSVEITSDIAVSAYSRQFATQLNVLSQLFYGQLESRVGRRLHSTQTSSRTSYGTTKRSQLWTTLTSSVCQHRSRLPIAVTIVCRCHRHDSLSDELTMTSCRCLIAVVVLDQRRHDGAITDETTTTSRRCLIIVSTVFAPLLLATLLVTLSLLIKLFLLLITVYPDNILSFSYKLSCSIVLFRIIFILPIVNTSLLSL